MQQTTKNNQIIVTKKGFFIIGFSRPVAVESPFFVRII